MGEKFDIFRIFSKLRFAKRAKVILQILHSLKTVISSLGFENGFAKFALLECANLIYPYIKIINFDVNGN